MYDEYSYEGSRATRRRKIRKQKSQAIETQAESARDKARELEFSNPDSMSLVVLYRALGKRGYAYNPFLAEWIYSK